MMENHDTFNPANVLEIENWILVGQAMLKMAGFFWPVLILMFVFFWMEKRQGAVK